MSFPPSSSRRQVLAAGAALGSLGLTSFLGTQSVREPTSQPGVDPEDLLDAAYRRVAERFPDVDIHRSNHAPMVAEALRTLGHAGAIAPWLDANLEGHERATSARRPIERERWKEALGHEERDADWQALFRVEIEREGWQPVLRRWSPRLVPGLAGAATHGLIRTAHATRAIAARDNDVRRFELATGLAYWAATYEELPWDGTLAPEPSVEAALTKVETRLPASEPPRGNIVDGLRALRDTPSFLPVAGLVDVRDPLATLTAMAPAFARLYLRNPERRIAFTHSITAPSALRLLAPYLDEETVEAGVRHAFQAAAGIHVVYGDPRRAAPAERAIPELDALVVQAIKTGGAHAIKLTEACLREDALTHDPVLLTAAHDAAESQTF